MLSRPQTMSFKRNSKTTLYHVLQFLFSERRPTPLLPDTCVYNTLILKVIKQNIIDGNRSLLYNM